MTTLVKESGDSAHSYLGADASEAQAKRLCGQASLLHFACHGLLDNDDPLASGLALTPGGGEDGLLQAWEIFEQVRLKADLVVLSACETGLGTTTRNEGVLGLTRALEYAGAHAVLASLWSIEDESTATLMTDFYANLKKQSKDVAWEEATQKLRQNPKYRHPYYWAPFILIGDWK